MQAAEQALDHDAIVEPIKLIIGWALVLGVFGVMTSAAMIGAFMLGMAIANGVGLT